MKNNLDLGLREAKMALHASNLSALYGLEQLRIKSVLEFSGPGHYLFLAGVNRDWRDIHQNLFLRTVKGLRSPQPDTGTMHHNAVFSPSRYLFALEKGCNASSSIGSEVLGKHAPVEVMMLAEDMGLPVSLYSALKANRCKEFMFMFQRYNISPLRWNSPLEAVVKSVALENDDFRAWARRQWGAELWTYPTSSDFQPYQLARKVVQMFVSAIETGDMHKLYYIHCLHGGYVFNLHKETLIPVLFKSTAKILKWALKECDLILSLKSLSTIISQSVFRYLLEHRETVLPGISDRDIQLKLFQTRQFSLLDYMRDEARIGEWGDFETYTVDNSSESDDDMTDDSDSDSDN